MRAKHEREEFGRKLVVLLVGLLRNRRDRSDSTNICNALVFAMSLPRSQSCKHCSHKRRIAARVIASGIKPCSTASKQREKAHEIVAESFHD